MALTIIEIVFLLICIWRIFSVRNKYKHNEEYYQGLIDELNQRDPEETFEIRKVKVNHNHEFKLEPERFELEYEYQNSGYKKMLWWRDKQTGQIYPLDQTSVNLITYEPRNFTVAQRKDELREKLREVHKKPRPWIILGSIDLILLIGYLVRL